MLPLIRRARGRVVFITSIGGRVAFPLNGAYHAAKFGIEAVGDVFRQELRPWGISVAVVEPGSIDTPIWERGERNADEIEARAHPRPGGLYGEAIARFREVVEEAAETGIPPEKVAAAIAHALEVEAPAHPLPGRPRRQGPGAAEAADPDPLFDRIVARQMHLRLNAARLPGRILSSYTGEAD